MYNYVNKFMINKTGLKSILHVFILQNKGREMRSCS